MARATGSSRGRRVKSLVGPCSSCEALQSRSTTKRVQACRGHGRLTSDQSPLIVRTFTERLNPSRPGSSHCSRHRPGRSAGRSAPLSLAFPTRARSQARTSTQRTPHLSHPIAVTCRLRFKLIRKLRVAIVRRPSTARARRRKTRSVQPTTARVGRSRTVSRIENFLEALGTRCVGPLGVADPIASAGVPFVRRTSRLESIIVCAPASEGCWYGPTIAEAASPEPSSTKPRASIFASRPRVHSRSPEPEKAHHSLSNTRRESLDESLRRDCKIRTLSPPPREGKRARLAPPPQVRSAIEVLLDEDREEDNFVALLSESTMLVDTDWDCRTWTSQVAFIQKCLRVLR